LGGSASSWRVVRTSTRAGPWCPKAARSASPSSPGLVDPRAEQPRGPGDPGEVGIVETSAVGDDPGGLHLQLHERQRVVVEHHDLHGKLLLAERDQLAEQHRKPAIARKRDHLPTGWLAWAPMACGSALAMDPWLKGPISRRLPFIRR
jgi:hypothetical protein